MLILLSILVNTGMLGAYDPLNPDSERNYALSISEYIFLGIFAFEAVVKLIGMGFIGHPGAYFRDPWNYLDFLIVVLSIVAVLPGSGENLSSIRALRVVRALRLVHFIPELRLQIETLIKAGPYLLNALLLLFIFYLIFALIGLQVFRGKLLQHCVNPAGLFDMEQTCTLSGDQGFNCALLGDGSVCQVTSLNPRYGQVSFDNFLLSIFTVFQVVTQENWSIVAVQVMDSVSDGTIVYFVGLILIGTFVLVNLFVSVVSGVLSLESATEAKKKRRPSRITVWWGDMMTRLKNYEEAREKKYKFIQNMHKIVDSLWFQIIIYAFIIINFILLLIEHYPQVGWLTEMLNVTDYILNSIFTVEIIMKWIGLGFYLWGQDGMNIFDFIVVLGSWIEIAAAGDFTVMRALRTVRLFRLLALWPLFDKILKTAAIGIRGSLWFMILFFLYLYIFAIIGMQVFGGKMFFTDGYPRWNFDNLWNAFLAVFLVLSGESWPFVMMDGIRAIGWGGAVYFVVFFAFGDWVVLNLFLAILLDAFEQEEQDEEDEAQRLEQERMDEDYIPMDDMERAARDAKQLKDEGETLNPHLGKEGKDFEARAAIAEEEAKIKRRSRLMESVVRRLSDAPEPIRPQKEPSTILEHSEHQKQKSIPKYDSCYIIPPTNTVRRAMYNLVEHPAFEGFILVSILVSCIMLALENPYWNSIAAWESVFAASTMLFMVIFFFEMVFKLIAFGVVMHEGAYLRNGWNVLDFCIVLVSFLAIVIDYTLATPISFLRAIRAFRAFRLMGRFKQTRLVALVLLYCIPEVINVVVFSILLWLIGGIIGVQLFAGKTALCNDLLVVSRAQCVGLFTDPDGNVIPRIWTERVWGSFNNIGMALYSLFPIIGISGWNDQMYATMDITGINLQPQRESAPAYAVYFVIFIIIGSWFTANLFTGAIVNTFKSLSRKFKSGGILVTDEQRQQIQLQKLMIKSAPKTTYKVPVNPFREYCYRFVINKYFTYFMVFVIFANIITMAMIYEGMSDEYEFGLNVANAIFMGIFVVEMVLKLVALGPKRYFTEFWNILDFIIVLASLADVFLTFLVATDVFSASVFRAFRVFTILKLVKWSQKLRIMMNSITISVPPVINVFLLWCIFIFIYAVIGVAVFGNAVQGGELTPPATFDNFGTAVYVLFRVVTSEAWEAIMYDLYNPPNNYLGSPAYFFSFMVLSEMMLLQIILGIMLESFQDQFLVKKGSLSNDSVEQFISAWSNFDPSGTQFIALFDLPKLLYEVMPPLGPGRMDKENMLRYISRLDLPIRKNKLNEDVIYYADLLRVLVDAASPSYVDMQALSEELEAKWKRAYPLLSEQKSFTVREYVAAVKLQRAFRRRQALKRMDADSDNAVLGGGSEMGESSLRLYDDVFSRKTLNERMRDSNVVSKPSAKFNESNAKLMRSPSADHLRRSSSKSSLLRQSTHSPNSTPIQKRRRPEEMTSNDLDDSPPKNKAEEEEKGKEKQEDDEKEKE